MFALCAIQRARRGAFDFGVFAVKLQKETEHLAITLHDYILIDNQFELVQFSATGYYRLKAIMRCGKKRVLIRSPFAKFEARLSSFVNYLTL